MKNLPQLGTFVNISSLVGHSYSSVSHFVVVKCISNWKVPKITISSDKVKDKESFIELEADVAFQIQAPNIYSV